MVEIAVFFALCAVPSWLFGVRPSVRRLVAMNDSPAAFATLGLNATMTKVVVFALAAGMAGLGGVLYGGETGAIGGNDTQLQFFCSLILLLFVAIWGIRTATGALLGGLSATLLPFAETHLPAAYAGLTGLVAGGGSSWPERRRGARPAPAAQPGPAPLRRPVGRTVDAGPGPRRPTTRSKGRSVSPEAATVSATAEPPAGRPVLEARGISVRFGGVAALTDVTLSVAAGRVTGSSAPTGPADRRCST